MANSDSKNRIEVEVAVRDAFSTTLKTMGAELAKLNKQALETGVSGAGGFDRFRRSNDQLNESNKRTTASFTAMSSITSVLTRGLVGTAGLAAGFYAVSKSLEDVSLNAIKLKNFSTDTGLAISKIQDLQQTLRRGGFSKSEGDSVIAAMGSMANNLAAFKESSEVYQKLMTAPGGAALATNLVNIAKTGDQAKVVSEYLRVFSQQSREAKFFMAEAAHTTVSALERMAEAAKKNSNIKVSPIDQAEADKIHQIWVDLEVRFENIFNNISNHGIKAFGALSDALKAEGVTTKGIADWVNAEVDQGLARIKTTIEEFKAIKRFFQESLPSFLGAGKYPQGEDPMGKDYTARSISSYNPIKHNPFKNPNIEEGTHSDITDFGGRAKSNDSVNILTDIRDTLQRIELGDKAGVTSGRGTSVGLSSQGLGRQLLGSRLGIDKGGRDEHVSNQDQGRQGDREGIFRQGIGRQDLASKLGIDKGSASQAIDRSMGATRGDRNNNPGNLKFGDHAKAFGATGADDKGFAIFPDIASGSAAQETLLKSDRYKGLTLDQFGDKYSQGNPGWKKVLGKDLNLGLNDIVNNQDPRLPGAIQKAEGTNRRANLDGNLDPRAMDPMAPAGSRLEQSTTVISSPSGAKFRVKSEFAPNFQRFINDYEKQGGVIGPNSGGLSSRPNNASYHPLGRAIDVNQIGYGIRGGGKILPRELEDQLAENAGLYPGSKFGRRSDEGHFEVRNREEALRKQREWANTDAKNRESVDKSQSGGGDKWGKINASVEFLNVPPGVRTKAETDGEIFKNLQINKTKQSGVYRQEDQAYD